MLRLFRYAGIRIAAESVPAFTEGSGEGNWTMPARKLQLQMLSWYDQSNSKGGSVCIGHGTADPDNTIVTGRAAVQSLVPLQEELEAFRQQREQELAPAGGSEQKLIVTKQKVARLEDEVTARDNQIKSLERAAQADDVVAQPVTAKAADPVDELPEPDEPGGFYT